MSNIYEIRSEEGGEVVNTIVADEGFVEVQYAGLYTKIGIVEDPAVPAIPSEITDRQFFQAIALPPWNLITKAEALAAVQTGAIPAAMQVFIDALPADQQFQASMLISGAQSFLRDNPLVSAFGAAQGMTPAQIDALWAFAKAL